MDADSLVYEIKTEDFYTDIADDVRARFDTSGYCPNRPLPIGLNKKVIGLMKDELGGAIMTEFVALRPKLYSSKKLDGSEDKKCKRIKKCVVKKTLTFEDYKTCLFNDSAEYRSQLMFRLSKHEVHTIEVNKVALNRDDDKRIFEKDGISTFARGHKDLSWRAITYLGLYIKMPHSNFKERSHQFNWKIGKCPCVKPSSTHQKEILP